MIWYDSYARPRRAALQRWTARKLPESEDYPVLPVEYAIELQQKIIGTVVLPGDPVYDADRMLSNPRFVAHPAVIVYCEAESDVAECLSVARRAKLPVVVRSGGHSTAGFSAQDGFLIDVSRLSDVNVDVSGLTAWAGPGTQFRKLNAKLEFYGLHTTLLHKSAAEWTSPFPGQSYPATSVMGVPSAVNPFSTATRTWNSAT